MFKGNFQVLFGSFASIMVLGGSSVSIAQTASAPVTSPTDLHRRAVAAIPAVQAGFDSQLTDYPSARFRNVQARLVRSIYSSDEGQSNRVPWTHRGNVVLILCGEINAKNRMGGYIGWERFAFEPAQDDVVTMYDFSKPRQPKPYNLATRDKLMVSGGAGYDDEYIGVLCGDDAELVDLADLSSSIAYSASR